MNEKEQADLSVAVNAEDSPFKDMKPHFSRIDEVGEQPSWKMEIFASDDERQLPDTEKSIKGALHEFVKKTLKRDPERREIEVRPIIIPAAENNRALKALLSRSNEGRTGPNDGRRL